MEEALIVLGVVVVGIYFLFRFFSGDLTIESTEIVRQGNITRYGTGTVIGYYYHIKTTYKSGRIKITEKEL